MYINFIFLRLDSCLKCQTDNKHDDCVGTYLFYLFLFNEKLWYNFRLNLKVVWGDCNHSFHNCCMSQWIKSRNLCPLCQSEWHVQRVGR
jgi:hypothetical protein